MRLRWINSLVVMCGVYFSTTSIGLAQLIRLRTQAVDQSNFPVSTVQAGQAFFLDLFADDLRPDGLGVFSAYADITYDPTKVMADGTYMLEGLNGQAAVQFSPGTINDAGTVYQSLTGPGPSERRLVRFPFHATGIGDVMFDLGPDGNIDFEVALYGLSQELQGNQIEYVDSSISVVPEPTGLSLAVAAIATVVLFIRRFSRP